MSLFQRHSSRGFERPLSLDSQAFSAVLGATLVVIVLNLVIGAVESADTAMARATPVATAPQA